MYYFILTIIFILFIVCGIIVNIYLKSKYGFWYYQPVIHSYDLFRLLQKPGIISPDLPSLNSSASQRFLITDPKTLYTSKVSDLTSRECTHFQALIIRHYLHTHDGNVYEPKSTNIWTYFIGHEYPCFISFYNEPIYYLDDVISPISLANNIIEDRVPIGSITSRPLNIYFNNVPVPVPVPVYYVEFLCVNKKNRKHGIAPKLIQTHEYNQRHKNTKISVSLFKHEDHILQGIVPLVVYSTYGFPITKWMKTPPPKIHPPYKMVAITPENIPDLIDFMKSQRTVYDVFIEPSIANVIELIKTDNIFIHVIFDLNSSTSSSASGQQIVAAYFYRKSCVRIEDGQGEVLTLFGSLLNSNPNTDLNPENNVDLTTLFILGFKNSFYTIAKKHQFGFCGIESISQNITIINHLTNKTKPTIISPTAYFFYNYIYPTVHSTQIFILS